ncbi:hypothetical protein TNCV_1806211 [Trichonephila clavipes]|nr:hypothetical protein TNCV_1806211 [Trichonephila clavipes]
MSPGPVDPCLKMSLFMSDAVSVQSWARTLLPLKTGCVEIAASQIYRGSKSSQLKRRELERMPAPSVLTVVQNVLVLCQ